MSQVEPIALCRLPRQKNNSLSQSCLKHLLNHLCTPCFRVVGASFHVSEDFIIYDRNRCRTAIWMHGRIVHSGFPVFHWKNLSIQLSADLTGTKIQHSHIAIILDPAVNITLCSQFSCHVILKYTMTILHLKSQHFHHTTE